ncbi:uncharacterized protein LOC125648758 [Ostrea edulis]|uniref:uncharacterized protein LOC125648758 n=1 Tax=Ostrea edulis TaxID=37623 RepID=UPI0024AEF0E7|nr:uncharacterized protein LOC125648758 [Ostrea edulis]
MHTCQYPKYGRRCLEGTCRCPPEFCDPSLGCRGPEKQTKGVLSTLLTMDSFSFSNSESTLDTTNIKSATQSKSDHTKYISNPSSLLVLIIILVIGVIVVGLFVAVVFFQLRVRIKLRFDKPPKRGSLAASQRQVHVDTYCAIEDSDVVEDGSNTAETEPEVYEIIDQSKKDITKYAALPSRNSVSKYRSKTPSTFSLQKILECNEEDKRKGVQMRKDKTDLQISQKRLGKTSAQVSGYIVIDKRKQEDYVSMDGDSLVSAIAVSSENVEIDNKFNGNGESNA